MASRRPWAGVVVSAGGRLVAGQNPAYGLLAPLARVVLAGLAVESWYRARTGRTVEWKGRAVPASPTRARSFDVRDFDVTDDDIAAGRADRLR